MPSLPAAVRLKRTYEVARLLKDCKALERFKRAREPYATYHNGKWMGISLHSAGGRADVAHGPLPGIEPYQETKALRHAPYMKEILDGLACPKQVVRLLELYPGGEIRPHRDPMGFQAGMLRLHLPIACHPDLVFVIGDEATHFQPGELWFGDFARPHHLINKTPVTKVALVIDVLVNEFVLSLFPEDYVAQVRSEGILMHRPAVELSRRELERFVCAFAFPADTLPQAPAGARGEIRFGEGALADRLAMYLDGEPAFALEPIASNRLGVANWGPGATIEVTFAGERVAAARLELRGFQGFNSQTLSAGHGAVKEIPLALTRGPA